MHVQVHYQIQAQGVGLVNISEPMKPDKHVNNLE